MPAFAAQYETRCENPVRPAIDEMLTIDPAPVAEARGTRRASSGTSRRGGC